MWWSSNPVSSRGLTLVELLVSLAILAILAGVAMPYAEVAWRRDQEMELRRSLRLIRTAIDRFHADALAGRISRLESAASEDKYPLTLEVLVNGVDRGDAKGSRIFYLRRIPRDPFARQDTPVTEQWQLRGYQDAPDALNWNGKDVYDVRSMSGRKAINGTLYRDW